MMYIRIFVLLTCSFTSFVDGRCLDRNGGCQHECTDIGQGMVLCACRPGYRLESNQMSCQDIDECAESNGGCSQKCINTEGSYRCECVTGIMSLDGITCRASSIRCYSCDSYSDEADDPTCVDPLQSTDALEDCPPDTTHCLKMKAMAYRLDRTILSRNTDRYSRQMVVSRHCVSAPDKSNGCWYFTGASSRYMKCYCDTNECNSSIVPTTSLSLSIISLISTALVVNLV